MAEHAEHGGHDAGHAHAAPHVNYWAIFGALCVLTLVSAAADFFGGDASAHGEARATAAEHAAQSGLSGKQIAVILVVMAVAIAKALFVIMYFMHVKFEGKWIWAMLLPTTVLALAIPAALLPDIGLHYYTVQTVQTEEYERQQSGMSTLGADDHSTDPARDPHAAHPSEPVPGSGKHPEAEEHHDDKPAEKQP